MRCGATVRGFLSAHSMEPSFLNPPLNNGRRSKESCPHAPCSASAAATSTSISAQPAALPASSVLIGIEIRPNEAQKITVVTPAPDRRGDVAAIVLWLSSQFRAVRRPDSIDQQQA